jgi:hypothetical protein
MTSLLLFIPSSQTHSETGLSTPHPSQTSSETGLSTPHLASLTSEKKTNGGLFGLVPKLEGKVWREDSLRPRKFEDILITFIFLG